MNFLLQIFTSLFCIDETAKIHYYYNKENLVFRIASCVNRQSGIIESRWWDTGDRPKISSAPPNIERAYQNEHVEKVSRRAAFDAAGERSEGLLPERERFE